LILNEFSVYAEAAGVIEMKLAGLPIVGGLRRGPRRLFGLRGGSWLGCGVGWGVVGGRCNIGG
jgi:hypothetical protein